MTRAEVPADATEDLFEDAPCGYLTTRPDGTLVRVNRTFEQWTGFSREHLIGRGFQELLAPGGRIYYETHYAPLLQMRGTVREIAVEIVRADGSRLPALVNSVLVRGEGVVEHVRTTVFDASERRRYEQELLHERRREHDIAQRLQRAMLDGELPEAPELVLDVAYRPAEQGLEVGGDWFDAFWLEPGRTVGLVVGDVVGRGIDAAATMGQLRSATRAIAATGMGPARLLDGLDAYASRHRVGQMATVVYAQLELATGQLRYACAGHLPPVVQGPDDAPTFLWEGRSTPLDIHVDDASRSEAAYVLPPGGTLILYTDGLVERRSETLEDGMERLLVQLAVTGPAAPGFAAALADELRGPDQDDDVCVLAACVGKQPSGQGRVDGRGPCPASADSA
jgi:PAS domain S-box-containing protein